MNKEETKFLWVNLLITIPSACFLLFFLHGFIELSMYKSMLISIMYWTHEAVKEAKFDYLKSKLK